MPISRLNYCASPKERWSVIYSLLKFGYIEKNIPSSVFQPFISKHLFKMYSKENYHWTNAENLRLTPEEKLWLIKYGEKIERADIGLLL